jgi:ion channel-forming bestrophin family protein
MHKDPKRHIRHFVTWGYSAATQRILFPDLAMIFSHATLLTLYNEVAANPLYMPPEPIVLPSVALGLLVTFRTNTANARYMEARQLWGEIVNTSRDITRLALQWMPQSKDDEFGNLQADRLCRYTKAFCIVLKYHLTIDGGNADSRIDRRDPDLAAKVKIELREELEKVCFNPEVPAQLRELDQLCESAHRPLWILQQMGDAAHAGTWARCGDRPDRTIRDVHAFERHLQRLCGAMGACERIHRTPIPTAFTRHASRFLTVWCALRHKNTRTSSRTSCEDPRAPLGNADVAHISTRTP